MDVNGMKEPKPVRDKALAKIINKDGNKKTIRGREVALDILELIKEKKTFDDMDQKKLNGCESTAKKMPQKKDLKSSINSFYKSMAKLMGGDPNEADGARNALSVLSNYLKANKKFFSRIFKEVDGSDPIIEDDEFYDQIKNCFNHANLIYKNLVKLMESLEEDIINFKKEKEKEKQKSGLLRVKRRLVDIIEGMKFVGFKENLSSLKELQTAIKTKFKLSKIETAKMDQAIKDIENKIEKLKANTENLEDRKEDYEKSQEDIKDRISKNNDSIEKAEKDKAQAEKDGQTQNVKSQEEYIKELKENTKKLETMLDQNAKKIENLEKNLEISEANVAKLTEELNKSREGGNPPSVGEAAAAVPPPPPPPPPPLLPPPPPAPGTKARLSTFSETSEDGSQKSKQDMQKRKKRGDLFVEDEDNPPKAKKQVVNNEQAFISIANWLLIDSELKSKGYFGKAGQDKKLFIENLRNSKTIIDFVENLGKAGIRPGDLDYAVNYIKEYKASIPEAEKAGKRLEELDRKLKDQEYNFINIDSLIEGLNSVYIPFKTIENVKKRLNSKKPKNDKEFMNVLKENKISCTLSKSGTFNVEPIFDGKNLYQVKYSSKGSLVNYLREQFEGYAEYNADSTLLPVVTKCNGKITDMVRKKRTVESIVKAGKECGFNCTVDETGLKVISHDEKVFPLKEYLFLYKEVSNENSTKYDSISDAFLKDWKALKGDDLRKELDSVEKKYDMEVKIKGSKMELIYEGVSGDMLDQILDSMEADKDLLKKYKQLAQAIYRRLQESFSSKKALDSYLKDCGVKFANGKIVVPSNYVAKLGAKVAKDILNNDNIPKIIEEQPKYKELAKVKSVEEIEKLLRELNIKYKWNGYGSIDINDMSINEKEKFLFDMRKRRAASYGYVVAEEFVENFNKAIDKFCEEMDDTKFIKSLKDEVYRLEMKVYGKAHDKYNNVRDDMKEFFRKNGYNVNIDIMGNGKVVDIDSEDNNNVSVEEPEDDDDDE